MLQPPTPEWESPIAPINGPHTLSLPGQVWHQLDRMQLTVNKTLRGTGVGNRPSVRRRPDMDFREHRKYIPGDDMRFVDWRASGRHEQVFLKQGEQPKETLTYILIDTSASMAWGEPGKHLTALALAAVIGYLTLTNGDRLVVYPLTAPNVEGQPLKAISSLGTISGKGQFPTLLHYLQNIPFSGQIDLGPAVKQFKNRVHRGGLTVLISDLIGVTDLEETLSTIPIPTWDVLLFHLLHPEELAPNLQGNFVLQDVETRATKNYDINKKAIQGYTKHLENWLDQIELTCIQNHTLYTLIQSNWKLDREIIPHLRSMNIIQPNT